MHRRLGLSSSNEKESCFGLRSKEAEYLWVSRRGALGVAYAAVAWRDGNLHALEVFPRSMSTNTGCSTPFRTPPSCDHASDCDRSRLGSRVRHPSSREPLQEPSDRSHRLP